MSDDVDDLLRRAMTTLDHQVPDGYFETLAGRTLARLDDPALGDPRDDDAGLQDIRNLAIETKARLSSRRSSKDLIVADDDRLASSSAGWKAVALPEPARPTAPPREADDVVDELARERAARDARAAQARRASAPVPGAAAAGEVAPSRAGQAGPYRRPILAVLGLGLAAAAGAMIFVSAGDKAETVASQERSDRAERVHSYAQAAAPASTPTGTAAANGAPSGGGLTVTPIETTAASGSAAAPEPAIEAQAGAAGRGAEVAKHAVEVPPRTKPVVAQVALDEGAVRVDKKPRPGKGGAKALPSKGKLAKAPAPDDAPPEGSAADRAPPEPRTGSGTPSGHAAGEPSFDKLLQEANVHDPKTDRPKLARKSLSSDDIKRGMDAVAPRAQACFAGTQGHALVRLTVAPSGQVQAVTVTGAFAGTPVAACVERAVRAATFPPWDGGPQSFGYDYLLSE